MAPTRVLPIVFVTMLASLTFAAPATQPSAAINIVPRPVSLSLREGNFQLNSATAILTDDGARSTAEQLANYLRPATGFDLPIDHSDAGRTNAIELSIDPSLAKLGEEGYRLLVTPERIEIRAPSAAGAFYGVQTLRQLLPAEIFAASPQSGVAWAVPCVQIEDYPRFAWRGLMLDCSRHFFPKEFVERFIDLLALHKMNSFHWHLTDDQGWRLEIKKYPKLTSIGAWRKETLVGHAGKEAPKYDGVPYGGFYTQQDVREIVAYAAARHVNVVPEIEMPGHSQAAIAAYPELGNTGAQLDVWPNWGVDHHTLNVSEKTIIFYQDVLTEVMDLFPSKYIHVGGDECPTDEWQKSPAMQQRMKELSLKNEHELQNYFMHRMDQFIASKGRKMIGWDEILEGGLAPGAAVMSWRGEKGGIAAAKSGHDAVMAPGAYTYFDHAQSKKNEPLSIGGFLPIDKVYAYEPIPKGLSDGEAKHILGAQGQLWSEYIPTPQHCEYMAYPRACALAEVDWSPKDSKNYDEFLQRLRVHLQRLAAMHVNYRPLDKASAGNDDH